MAEFKLRAWRTQTLRDEQDYIVDADTLAQAIAKLADAQQAADDADDYIQVEGIDRILYGDAYSDDVKPLDPEEICDGDCGIEVIEG